MSEIEVVEAFGTFQEMALSAATLFISLLTGYLLIAYFIGRDLSSTQLWTINILFAAVSLPTAMGAAVYTDRAMEYGWDLAVMQQREMLFPSSFEVVGPVSGLAFMCMIFAAYYFMWVTRRSSSLE